MKQGAQFGDSEGDGFGTSLAFANNLLYVGAPGEGDAGAVFVAWEDAVGPFQKVQNDTFLDDGGAKIGASLAVINTNIVRIFAGAPGAYAFHHPTDPAVKPGSGAVAVFRPNPEVSLHLEEYGSLNQSLAF
jgi:hypothetical protein